MTAATDDAQAEWDVLMVPIEYLTYADAYVDALEARGAAVRTVEGYFPVLAGLLRGGPPDVLHLHYLHALLIQRHPILMAISGVQLLLAITITKLLGARVVWTVHNRWGHESRSPRIEVVVRHFVCRLCDGIAVHCGAARGIVAETYRLPPAVRRRIEVVPHGNFRWRYPDEVTRATARDELGLDDEEFVFLYYGLIRPYKNVDRLVRTFKRLDLPGARLLVTGRPNVEDLERTLVRLCEGDERIRARFEFIPDEETQLYMRAADVVVLPFRSTLTSGTVVLAMTFERPVIAPALGCVAELLGDEGGFPYDPDDPDGLETAMARASRASRSELEAMGRRNVETVEPLEWDMIADRTVALYAGRR